jgi:HSP20 family molecular chaperone IbpA
MQNNPDDDVLNNVVKKIVEDIIRTFPNPDGARIVGYTVITGFPGDNRKRVIHSEDENRIPYEIIESDDAIFITATLPTRHESAPFADINPNMVRVCVDDRMAAIDLPCMVDVIHSGYRVHRGVMDITLRKAKPVRSYLSGPGV